MFFKRTIALLLISTFSIPVPASAVFAVAEADRSFGARAEMAYRDAAEFARGTTQDFSYQAIAPLASAVVTTGELSWHAFKDASEFAGLLHESANEEIGELAALPFRAGEAFISVAGGVGTALAHAPARSIRFGWLFADELGTTVGAVGAALVVSGVGLVDGVAMGMGSVARAFHTTTELAAHRGYEFGAAIAGGYNTLGEFPNTVFAGASSFVQSNTHVAQTRAALRTSGQATVALFHADDFEIQPRSVVAAADTTASIWQLVWEDIKQTIKSFFSLDSYPYYVFNNEESSYQEIIVETPDSEQTETSVIREIVERVVERESETTVIDQTTYVSSGGLTLTELAIGLAGLRAELVPQIELAMRRPRIELYSSGGGGGSSSSDDDDIDLSGYLELAGGTLTGALAGTSAAFSGALSSATLSVAGTTTLSGVAYDFPNADGTSGQLLTTDGTGGLSWTTVAGGVGTTTWGTIEGTLANQTDLQTALDEKLSTTNATSTNFAVIGTFNLLGTLISDVGAWFAGLFDSNFATKDTGDLAEGANLYYTDERVGNYITASTTLATGINYWTEDSGNVYRMSGRVGIGTDSPSTLLGIEGLSPAITLADNRIATNFQTYQLRSSAVGAGFDIFDTTQNATRVLVDSDGRFAIGTTTIPSESKVFVWGGASGANVDIRSSADTEPATVEVQSYDFTDSFKSAYLQFNGPNALGTILGGTVARANLGVLAFQNSTNALIYTSNAAPIIFGTDATERMRISDTGNVGIGTPSPGYKLDVTTSGQNIARFYSSSTASGLGIWGLTTNQVALYPVDSNDSLVFYTGGLAAEAARFDTSGRFGIGDASPAALLTVGASDAFQVDSSGRVLANVGASGAGNLGYSFVGDTDTGFYRSASDEISLQTAGITRLTVNSTGQVVTTGVIRAADGSASVPGYGFSATGSVGMYRTGGNQLVLRNSGPLGVRIYSDNGPISFGPGASEAGVTPRLDILKIASNDIQMAFNTTGSYITYANTADTLTFASSTGGYIFSDGNVGIGTTTPSQKLTVDGNVGFINLSSLGVSGDALCLTAGNEVAVNTGAQTCTVSSLRFKHNDAALETGLDTVRGLTAKSFIYNGTDDIRIGLVAEEVELVDARLVFYEPDGETPRGVRYEDIVALLVKAIQELDAKIELLLANAASGVSNFFEIIAERITTKELCLEDVCITKTELQQLLDSAQVDSYAPPALEEEPEAVENDEGDGDDGAGGLPGDETPQDGEEGDGVGGEVSEEATPQEESSEDDSPAGESDDTPSTESASQE